MGQREDLYGILIQGRVKGEFRWRQSPGHPTWQWTDWVRTQEVQNLSLATWFQDTVTGHFRIDINLLYVVAAYSRSLPQHCSMFNITVGSCVWFENLSLSHHDHPPMFTLVLPDTTLHAVANPPIWSWRRGFSPRLIELITRNLLVCYSFIFSLSSIQIVTYLVVCTSSDTCKLEYMPHLQQKHLILHPERESACWVLDERKTTFFMISQLATPSLPRIPGTTKEVLAIKRLLQNHDVQVLCLDATVNQGITNMETHSCIHFACHAHQNAREPLKMLHDVGLELFEIIKWQLVGADLAFLSACQTSTDDEKLSEEAVHFAAGMMAAGYRGVVASMWSIPDRHGPQVAEDFYARLILSQDLERLSGLSTDNVVCALLFYASTQKFRKQLGGDGDLALDWIPYVHFGL